MATKTKTGIAEAVANLGDGVTASQERTYREAMAVIRPILTKAAKGVPVTKDEAEAVADAAKVIGWSVARLEAEETALRNHHSAVLGLVDYETKRANLEGEALAAKRNVEALEQQLRDAKRERVEANHRLRSLAQYIAAARLFEQSHSYLLGENYDLEQILPPSTETIYFGRPSGPAIRELPEPVFKNRFGIPVNV